MLICKLEEKNAQPFQKRNNQSRNVESLLTSPKVPIAQKVRGREWGEWEEKMNHEKRSNREIKEFIFCRWHDEEESNVDRKKGSSTLHSLCLWVPFFPGVRKNNNFKRLNDFLSNITNNQFEYIWASAKLSYKSKKSYYHTFDRCSLYVIFIELEIFDKESAWIAWKGELECLFIINFNIPLFLCSLSLSLKFA